MTLLDLEKFLVFLSRCFFARNLRVADLVATSIFLLAFSTGRSHGEIFSVISGYFYARARCHIFVHAIACDWGRDTDARHEKKSINNLTDVLCIAVRTHDKGNV